ncbi:glycosyltransferase family 4 protein [Pseudoalteromonas sp. NEC-BIFX-2020_002]|uniref:glycosyltransferase family 4 protein n=1 Tax=Pseudoalteromonas sp. NEC-BIFX-2020_002 TaxID=2732353 RepID=UPI0014778610|nr:glycosyltransferase family 4 protein [Pseudoalteromonas sp. NEC-BIFX-2020_002]NNG45157.1 glycosyltransferase family 4 protein [Pseudoalteromonas sp. NEC-BIFX-2020_002]
MKILQVITRVDTVGGAQRHVFDISKALINDGYEVNVLSSGNGSFRDLLNENGIAFVDVKNIQRELSLIKDLKAILSIRKYVKYFKPDVVAIHSVKAGLLARIACFGIDTKVIFTAHGWSHIRASSGLNNKIYKYLERFLSCISTKIICVSSTDTDFAENVIGIPSNKLCTIHNGALDNNHTVFFNEHRTLQILSVVRFQEPKDFNTLIEGLCLITEYDWVLRIVGDGPDAHKVHSLIKESNLSDKVLLEGFKEDLSHYYSSSDLVLLISKSEGLPMSLIEAMSYSKPLVASNVGGIPELISSNNGILVPDRGAVELSDAIKQFINDKNKGDFSMGLNSYELFLKKFEFSVMYNKLLTIYKGNK